MAALVSFLMRLSAQSWLGRKAQWPWVERPSGVSELGCEDRDDSREVTKFSVLGVGPSAWLGVAALSVASVALEGAQMKDDRAEGGRCIGNFSP